MWLVPTHTVFDGRFQGGDGVDYLRRALGDD
jgi:hypothetical protein